jgi:hypothetical protein
MCLDKLDPKYYFWGLWKRPMAGVFYSIYGINDCVYLLYISLLRLSKLKDNG